MGKKNKGMLFNLGDKEGILSQDEAVEFIKSRLTFVPDNPRSQQIDNGIARKLGMEHNIEGKPSDRIQALAEATVKQLSGVDNRFTRFTSESLITMNKDMFDTLIDAEFNEDGRSADVVDQAIQGVTAPNGKTFTSVQALDAAHYMADDFPAFCNHFATVRLPMRWAKQEENTVVPRGIKSAQELLTNGLIEYQIEQDSEPIFSAPSTDKNEFANVIDNLPTESEQTSLDV